MPKLKDILSFLFTQTAARTDELKRAGKLSPGHVPIVRLQAGTIIQCSDRKYCSLQTGAWVRVQPKPYRNKAERKVQKREGLAQRWSRYNDRRLMETLKKLSQP